MPRGVSGAGASRRLSHPALRRRAGRPLDAARLTDRQRLAVLLQGGSLLSHLELAGLRLACGWEPARVDRRGLLRSIDATPGRERKLPQALLSDLAARLFGGESPVAGRGQARRAARSLQERWRQGLEPIPPDRAVGQILDAARFLWEPKFGAARAALAAEHRGPGGPSLWVAGPGWLRGTLLAGGPGSEELARRLEAGDSPRLWAGRLGHAEPARLAAEGRWREAVELWRRRPPRTAEARVALARCHWRLGRFREAERTLARLGGGAARALRARCLCRLGRLRAARRALDRLSGARLSPAEVLAVAETAVPLLAAAGAEAAAAAWVERALVAATPAERTRAELLAAAAAWDRDRPERARRGLARARSALDDPALAWRWRQVRALLALGAGDGPLAVRCLERALSGRRALTPGQAAALWNDLGIGRALAGDLAGAERAFGHGLRLIGEWEGPRRTTLALFNLAEIRLRRGRPRGVKPILERSTAENRAAGNWRGWAHDQQLWTRFELARGRPRQALRRAREAGEELERRGLAPLADPLRALAARALGWMGRRREALSELERAGPAGPLQFEPEERPALWALAGARRRARSAIEPGPLAPLARALLSGRPPATPEWRRLEALEPYRAARWVLDAELIEPGITPPGRRRRAEEVLRRLGAGEMAGRLSGGRGGLWRVLGAYLRSPGGGGGGEAIRPLFEAAAGGKARLAWEREGVERCLVPGEGGGEAISAELAGGRLELRAPRIDGVLEALFSLALRDLEPPGSPQPPPPDGIVGESRGLTRALRRADRLAPHDLPVLLTGETGTGKDLLAHRIHARSPRAAGPFVAVNCAAFSKDILLADLFGHARGAFTGADRERAGLFETGDGGTVFLDEVGDLPPEAQAALLRVLQEGEVRRVGESLPRRVNARIIAATHRDLAALVAEGRFREDLLFRLRVATVALPALRSRRGDIPLLTRHFLEQIAGGRALRISREAERLLAAHPWPGNVRELKNRLAFAAQLAEGGVIRPRHLELGGDVAEPRGSYHEQVRDLRRRLVLEALRATGGNRAAAARRLGITRQALAYLLDRLEIEP